MNKYTLAKQKTLSELCVQKEEEIKALQEEVKQLREAASALEEYISSSSSIEMLFTEDGDCPLTKLRIALGVRQ